VSPRTPLPLSDSSQKLTFAFVFFGFVRFSLSQEILSQLKPKERKEKLEETFNAVKADYERILERARLD